MICSSNCSTLSQSSSLADNHHVPVVGSTVTTTARFWQRNGKGVFMVDRNNAGKLLLFPAPTPASGSSAEDWDRRILETRDNLVGALEFLRTVYNERLAGRPIKAADQILTQVETILRHDEKIPPYTVVGAIKVHGSASPEMKRTVLLVFPASWKPCLKNL